MVHEELDRSKKAREQVAPPAAANAHLGWHLGGPGDARGEFHYKATIAASHIELERAIVQAHPGAGYERPYNATIRQYVESLVEERILESAPASMAFVQMYERARFGDGDFTLEEWTGFVKLFNYLLSRYAPLSTSEPNPGQRGSR